MRIIKPLSALAFMVVSSPAFAGTEILFEKVPAWVVETDLNETIANEKSPDNIFVIVDKQAKLENGENFSYFDFAIRATSTEVLPVIAGLIKGSWQPDQGDLIIHRLEILRDGKAIKPLQTGLKFDVIRREKNLEKRQINGVLTATTQLEDIQIGDIVRFSGSTTRLNPALAGRVEYSSKILKNSFVMSAGKWRVIWPKSDKLRWNTLVDDHPVKLSQTGRYSELHIDLASENEIENPEGAPTRFRTQRYFEASSFQTWEEVSAVTARLYKTEGQIAAGGALESAVNSIASKTSDPMERTALAVQLVQDKVRYLYNGLGFGNYVPQSPEETWKLRYGDCKAKTLLLLSILDRLGIDAHPALVSTSWQDGVKKRLPGFQAFDHIIVRAQVNGETLWLDGTGLGTRLEDLRDVPKHRYALPVMEKGAGLEEIAIRPIGRPYHDVWTHYDMSTGTALPALFELKTVLRTSQAKDLNNAQKTLSAKDFQEKLDDLIDDYVVESVISEGNFSYDEQRSEATLTARGISYLEWKPRLGKKRHDLWTVVSNIDVEVDRTKPEWKNVPIKVSYPNFYKDESVFTLPARDIVGSGAYSLVGKQSLQESIAGFMISRSTGLADDKLVFRESYYPSRWEIAADQLPQEKKRLAAAKKKKVSLLTPKTLAENWKQIEHAKSNGSLAPFIAEFDKIVARNPEEELPYEQRAYFFQLIGDYEKAAADLERSAAIEPTASTYNWQGDLLVGTKPDKAIQSYKNALALDPVHSGSVIDLVDLYLDQEKPKQAKMLIEKARASGLSDEAADELEAVRLFAVGKQEEADALLSKLIDEDPDSLSLLNERCWLRGRGNYELEGALDDCTEAVELAKNPSSYLDSRALVYFRLGMYDDAIADLNRALRLNPDLSSSRYLRAIVHKAKGDLIAAENDYAEAVSLYKYVSRIYDRFGLRY